MKPIPRSAQLLSLLSALGACIASLLTLALPAAFPDPIPPTKINQALAEARGWAVVTLALALPLQLIALRAARRGALSARLIWLGVLAYLVYTFLELAVAPPFTFLYLVYIATFACAIPALVMGVASVDPLQLAQSASARVPRRSVAAYGIVAGVGLSLAWLKGIVNQSLAGEFGWPNGEAAIGHVVHALDLGLQVPLCLAAAIMLLRRRPAGYVVAAIMLVNAICMGSALVAMVAVGAVTAGRSPLEAAPFVVLPLAAAVLAHAYFRALGAPAPAAVAASHTVMRAHLRRSTSS